MTEIARSCLLLVPVDQAYAVVADIECYAQFLPGCKAVTVLSREQDAAGIEWVDAEVTVAKAGARYQFVTQNKGHVNERIEVTLQKGPFERLQGEWRFKALGADGCRVDLQLEFVATGLLAGLINPIAQKAADRMVDAFSHRIHQLAEQAGSA